MRSVILILPGPASALGVAVVVATLYGTRKAPYHPATLVPIVADYVPAVLIALGLGVGLGRLVARLGDAVASFDPDDPPAFLRIAARWRRALRSLVGDRVDQGIGAYRTRTRRHGTAHSRSRYARRSDGPATRGRYERTDDGVVAWRVGGHRTDRDRRGARRRAMCSSSAASSTPSTSAPRPP